MGLLQVRSCGRWITLQKCSAERSPEDQVVNALRMAAVVMLSLWIAASLFSVVLSVGFAGSWTALEFNENTIPLYIFIILPWLILVMLLKTKKE
jgi:hypothetical protein